MTRRLSLSSGARPSLSKMFATCFSTTFGEMNSVVAMAALERPWAMSDSTSRSRGVRAARVSPRRLAASDLIRLRIHRMPSGSSPLTGSSNIRICGSPSSAAAMPSRCRMPSENPLVRLAATSARPARPSTSSTRRRPIPLVWARPSRWSRAARPPWTAAASSSAPTSCIGAGEAAYGLPLTVTVPAEGRSRPRISRMVVVLPAPLGLLVQLTYRIFRAAAQPRA